MGIEELRRHVGRQSHLLKFWDTLNEAEQAHLEQQLLSIDFARTEDWFNQSGDQVVDVDNLTPIPDAQRVVLAAMSEDDRLRYYLAGLEAIARGEVAAVVLAGGQATRLGSDVPKGTLELHFADVCDFCPQNSLLGYQAGKIAALERLAKAEYPHLSEGKIQWVVMTSKPTQEATLYHLDTILSDPRVNETLTKEQITNFNQDDIPAYDMEGNFLLSSKHSVVMSPNGNGGIYSGLAAHLPELKKRGVKYFHVYCVDNILCKVADPTFIGFAIEKNADVLTKTLEKKEGELIGSVCMYEGKPRMTEYSELGAELAGRLGPDGQRLLFADGSIANHLFSMEFLEGFCTRDFTLPFHRALKKIPFVNADGELVKPAVPNGIKLEQFIFDVFPRSTNFFIWEVERHLEFSPLKNSLQASDKDNLSTCLRDMWARNMIWMRAVGATFDPPYMTEFYLQSTLTYDGEGLTRYRDRVFDTACCYETVSADRTPHVRTPLTPPTVRKTEPTAE